MIQRDQEILETTVQGRLDGFSNNKPKGDCVQCPHSAKENYEIKMDALAWGYIQSIMYKMKSYEFAAYLLGTVSPEGTHFVIEDYYIPFQKVSGGKVDITEELYTIPKEIREKIVGHLHSHHHMGSFSSEVDIDHFNYPLHIVISDQGKYLATVRNKTECEKWMRIEGIPITFFGSYVDEDELEKIEKIVYQFQIPTVNLMNNEDDRCVWCDQVIIHSQKIHYMGDPFCSDACVEEYKIACLEGREIPIEYPTTDIQEDLGCIPIIEKDVEEKTIHDGMII